MPEIEKELATLDKQMWSINDTLRDCKRTFGGFAPLGFGDDEFSFHFEKLAKGSLINTKDQIDYVCTKFLNYVEDLSEKFQVDWKNTNQVLDMERGNPYKRLVAQFKGLLHLTKEFDRMFPDSMEEEIQRDFNNKMWAENHRNSIDKSDPLYGGRVIFSKRKMR